MKCQTLFSLKKKKKEKYAEIVQRVVKVNCLQISFSTASFVW